MSHKPKYISATTLKVERLAQAYDSWKEEPGAFNQVFHELLETITTDQLNNIIQSFDLEVEKIGLDHDALESYKGFEAFYTRTYQKIHRLAFKYSGFQLPQTLAASYAERIFLHSFKGGIGEALDHARKFGLRTIVQILKEEMKEEAISQFIDHSVSEKINMPHEFHLRLMAVIKESLDLRQKGML